MAIYFDSSYYLNAKLQHLKATGETDAHGNAYTLASLNQTIAHVGMTPESHYATFGRAEGLNPNPYFNEVEYLAAKLEQLHSLGEQDANGNAYTIGSLRAIIDSIGMTPAEHYEAFGSFETTASGHLINPSNAFDANAYMAAKLLLLQASDPSWLGKSPADVAKAIADAGMSALSHYALYGAAEATAAHTPLVQTVPSAQRVGNDPGREALGEGLPPNYNPATSAPDIGTAQKPPKPADIGQKVPNTISPSVPSAATSPLVPGDKGYIAPPANAADTHAKPLVMIVSASGDLVYGFLDPATGKVYSVGADGKPTADLIGMQEALPPLSPDDVTAPTFVSAAANGAILTLGYDETIDSAHLPGAGAFTVMVNGHAVTISAVSSSGTSIILIIDVPVLKGDVVTASYRDPVTGNAKNAIQDVNGNDAASILNSPVNNITPEAPVGPPHPPVDPPVNPDVPAPPVGNFTATVAGNGDVTFGGTTAGDITLAWAGTVGHSPATFTNGGTTATADFGANAKAIIVGAGQTLFADLDHIDTVAVSGLGTLSIRGTDGADSLTLLKSVSTVVFDGMAGADTLIIANGGINTRLQVKNVENVNGGNGNDTITVLNTSASTITVNGGDGNDNISFANANKGNAIINGGAGNDSIMGTEGDDFITGGKGSDTFVFGAFGYNGVDTITDFAITNDKLDFKAFLGDAGGAITQGNGLKVLDPTAPATSLTDANHSIIGVQSTGNITNLDYIAKLFDDGNGSSNGFNGNTSGGSQQHPAGFELFTASSSKVVILFGDIAGGGDIAVYYVDNSQGTNPLFVQRDDISLVGSITATDLNALTADNFA